ncbi:MAG: hypothetical protein R3E12_11215 [Candidatus Eisenbacteria bacterium]
MRLLPVLGLCLAFSYPAVAFAHHVYGEGDALVLLRTAIESGPPLQEAGYHLVAEVPEGYLAFLDGPALAEVSATGLSYEVLVARDDASLEYVIVYDPQPGHEIVEPAAESVVLHAGRGYRVMSVPAASIDGEPTGVSEIQRVFRRPLSFVRTPWMEPHRAVSVDPEVAAGIATVNAAALQSGVQTLQDFGTRYSQYNGGYLASVWIRDQFLSYGYTDVTFHDYNSWNDNVVCVKPGAVTDLARSSSSARTTTRRIQQQQQRSRRRRQRDRDHGRPGGGAHSRRPGARTDGDLRLFQRRGTGIGRERSLGHPGRQLRDEHRGDGQPGHDLLPRDRRCRGSRHHLQQVRRSARRACLRGGRATSRKTTMVDRSPRAPAITLRSGQPGSAPSSSSRTAHTAVHPHVQRPGGDERQRLRVHGQERERPRPRHWRLARPFHVAIAHDPLGNSSEGGPFGGGLAEIIGAQPLDPSGAARTIASRRRSLRRSAAALPTGQANQFGATIPAVPVGSAVEYYLSAADIDGYLATLPEGAPGSSSQFRTGVSLVFVEDAETDQGWTLGVPGDNATTGLGFVTIRSEQAPTGLIIHRRVWACAVS